MRRGLVSWNSAVQPVHTWEMCRPLRTERITMCLACSAGPPPRLVWSGKVFQRDCVFEMQGKQKLSLGHKHGQAAAAGSGTRWVSAANQRGGFCQWEVDLSDVGMARRGFGEARGRLVDACWSCCSRRIRGWPDSLPLSLLAELHSIFVAHGCSSLETLRLCGSSDGFQHPDDEAFQSQCPDGTT